MAFLKSFISVIGHFFADLFDATAKAYKNLSVQEQNAAKVASGIIAIINANLDKVPAVVYDLIALKFPQLSKEDIAMALAKVNKAIKKTDELNVSPDLETELLFLQEHLKSYKDKEWIVITKAVVALLAIVFAPQDTIVQKIELVLEYVYQNFIKGKVTAVAG
jgi:BarA-like signal transduction histidine kinase